MRMLRANSCFDIIFGLGLAFMILGILFHSGVKEHYFTYFILPAVLCPLIFISCSKNKLLNDILYSTLMIIIFWLLAEFFWMHMDRPFFSPEPVYEGQYGWFSFENHLRSSWFPVLGSVSICIGTIIRLLRRVL